MHLTLWGHYGAFLEDERSLSLNIYILFDPIITGEHENLLRIVLQNIAIYRGLAVSIRVLKFIAGVTQTPARQPGVFSLHWNGRFGCLNRVCYNEAT